MIRFLVSYYNWYAVNDYGGLSLTGWHIPTDSDWTKLVKYLDSSADTTGVWTTQSTVAGHKLKSAGKDDVNAVLMKIIFVLIQISGYIGVKLLREQMRVVLQFSHVVLVVAMVIFTVLGNLLASGVLLDTTATSPGAANCSTVLAMCKGPPSEIKMGFPFAASGIDYLWEGSCGWQCLKFFSLQQIRHISYFVPLAC